MVDEFAHTNVPGIGALEALAGRASMLDAGIDVLTTMNVQHLESLNDQVFHATGIRVRETVPDWVVDEADELVFVDLTPRALRNRLERGVVYSQEKARRAMENFFTESNLTALREMALRHTAHEVEEKLDAEAAAASRGIGGRIAGRRAGARPPGAHPHLPHRPAFFRYPDPPRKACGRLYSRRLHGVHVGDETHNREAVERHMSFARNLRIETHVLPGKDVPGALASFARARGVTQIFMGRSAPLPWWKRYRETIVQQVVRQARDMQITIVAERRR